VYAYVSNESQQPVYFDNFQVTHIPGPLLEENHYYPTGNRMTAICSRAVGALQTDALYQGKDLTEDFDLDVYDFHARSYDPLTGRFLQIDPEGQFASGYTGMGNSWPNGVDPDGKWLHIALGAVIGGVVNVVTNAGSIGGVGDFFGFLASGAAGGAITAAGNPMLGAMVTSGINGVLMGHSVETIAQNVVTSGITSVVGGQLGGAIAPAIQRITGGITSPIVNGIVRNGIGSAFVGTLLGGSMGFLQTGTFSGFASGAGSGFTSGLATGAFTGAVQSSVAAFQSGINPITGRQLHPEPPPRVVIQPVTVAIEHKNFGPTSAPQALLGPPNYQFDKMNGAVHWLKHSQALLHKNGEFVRHPQKRSPDMPRELTLRAYKEGASNFFRTTNSATASFTGSNGKLYLYNSQTHVFGIANATTGQIITWFKANDRYWLKQINKFNK